jgi:hypothetical protein
MAEGLAPRTADLVVHGGEDHLELRRLGVDPEGLLDFSVSLNPYGPHPEMVRGLREARLADYPELSFVMKRRMCGSARSNGTSAK